MLLGIIIHVIFLRWDGVTVESNFTRFLRTDMVVSELRHNRAYVEVLHLLHRCVERGTTFLARPTELAQKAAWRRPTSDDVMDSIRLMWLLDSKTHERDDDMNTLLNEPWRPFRGLLYHAPQAKRRPRRGDAIPTCEFRVVCHCAPDSP